MDGISALIDVALTRDRKTALNACSAVHHAARSDRQ